MGDKGFFVTGTDTEVGKTLVSATLLDKLRGQGLRVAGMKPVAAGCDATVDGLRNEDALMLQAHSSLELPYGLVNPYALAPPIAPHIAAREAGVEIDIPHLLKAWHTLAEQVDRVVVEGAGGWLVPIGPRGTLEDLAIALQLPVILVVDIRLGCINHALLSTRAIAAAGLPLAGWVANHVHGPYARSADNIASIESRVDSPLLGVVPHLESAGTASIADLIRLP